MADVNQRPRAARRFSAVLDTGEGLALTGKDEVQSQRCDVVKTQTVSGGIGWHTATLGGREAAVVRAF